MQPAPQPCLVAALDLATRLELLLELAGSQRAQFELSQDRML